MNHTGREFRFDEISIFCVLQDLWKYIWVIVLAAAAAWLAVTGVLRLLYVPEYTVSATIAVNAKGNNSVYASLPLANEMAGVFAEVFQSDAMKEKIAEDLGESTFEDTVQAQVMEETNLISIQITSRNPRRAYMAVHSALHNYDEVSDYLISNATLRVIRQPEAPYEPSNPMKIGRLQGMAVLLGAVGACGLIALVSVMRFTVRTRTGARRNLDGRILETIPFERKNKTFRGAVQKEKKSLLISSALVSMPFGESVRKAATKIDQLMKQKHQNVLLVTSVAENEGKSSVAANLALALAEKGKKVLLIDGDLKKPAQYKIFEKETKGRKFLSDYLQKKAEIKDVLTYEKKEHIFTVFQEKSIRNAGKYLDSTAMKALIDAGRKKMDYVIIDTPPMSVSSDAEMMLELADSAVLVARQDWTDIRAVNEAVDTIQKAKVDFAGFILNAFYREKLFPNSREHSYYYGYHRTDSGGEV